MSYNGKEIYAEDAEVIAIYSIDGRTIAQRAGNTISTAELASGVYIAVAKLNKGTEVLRFVVE